MKALFVVALSMLPLLLLSFGIDGSRPFAVERNGAAENADGVSWEEEFCGSGDICLVFQGWVFLW